MSLHDDYARVTPFELTFPTPDAAAELVAKVDEEAAGRGADPSDPHAFVTMGAVASFVSEIEGPDAPPGSIHQYGALAFHGVHFSRADRPLYLMTAHVARYLAEGAPPGSPRPPSPAGYLQLPQHLFWAEPVPGEAPESVDGLFWTATPAGLLHTMLVTGVRPDRAGLAVVPLPEAPLADAPAWLDAETRPDGEDFASSLPGSELDRLYAFQTAGEAFKLVARFFAYLESAPEAAVSCDPGSGVADEARAAGPRPSELPYRRVTLDA